MHSLRSEVYAWLAWPVKLACLKHACFFDKQWAKECEIPVASENFQLSWQMTRYSFTTQVAFVRSLQYGLKLHFYFEEDVA